MDGPYLLFGYALALLLVLVGFRVVRRGVPELRGIRQLSIFVLCGVGGTFLMAARDRAPAFLSVFVGNSLLLFGPLFFYAAAAEILAVRARGIRWLIALTFAGVPVMYWASLIHPHVLVRLLVHGTVIGTIFAASAILLFRDRDVSIRAAARGTAWLSVGMAALESAWVMYPRVLGITPNFEHPDLADAGFSYLAMILALAAVGALSWLSLCVHRGELERVAQTDSLTGLLNRGAFEVVLRRDLQRCHHSGATLSVMMLDLDYFKQVNDSFGHGMGDRVLRRISASLAGLIRPSDVLSRYGGEEFVVLLRDSGADDAQVAAERIRSSIEALRDLPEGITMTASIGVAVNLPGESPDELLLRADEALYRSKKEGRNLVTLYRSPRRSKVVSM